ncbi:MAG: hypothetical protein ACYTEQ_18260 [Planctomycetota bacterium]|jgi:hypothetical protein
MATNTHFHPPATVQLTADDALSVGLMRALQDNTNHLKLRWQTPRRGEGAFPGWNSQDSNINEFAVMMFCPLLVPSGYTKLRVSICHELAASATSTTTWKLYCSSGMYVGPQDPFDATKLPNGYQVATITTNTTSSKWADTTIELRRDSAEGTWLVLTATNGDDGTTAKITSFTFTPQIL